jgi:hypothetical protein
MILYSFDARDGVIQHTVQHYLSGNISNKQTRVAYMRIPSYFSLTVLIKHFYVSTDFKLSWWFTLYVDPAPWYLRRVEMESVTDVTEVHAALIFGIEVSSVSEPPKARSTSTFRYANA